MHRHACMHGPRLLAVQGSPCIVTGAFAVTRFVCRWRYVTRPRSSPLDGMLLLLLPPPQPQSHRRRRQHHARACEPPHVAHMDADSGR